MKSDKNINNRKAKIEKFSKNNWNNKLIIVIVIAILFSGIIYVETIPTKDKKITTSLKEVRTQIDSEYGTAMEGMGTNTPAVRDNYNPILSPKKADKLPDYVYTNAMTLKAYEYATEHPEILEQIPCYCGCGQHGSEASEGKPHRFLRDCFINDNGIYDNHASFCDVCVGINSKVQSLIPSSSI